MARHVLDSSAVLAAMLEEPGAQVVRGLLKDSLMCAVNVTEIVTRLYDKGCPMDHAARRVSTLFSRIAPFDDILAFRAAWLRAETRPLGLSLGDRACIALGMAARMPIYTADREWAELDIGADIRLIR